MTSAETTSFTSHLRNLKTDRSSVALAEWEFPPKSYPLVSVDDHLMESPTLFQDRLPASYQDRAPRVEAQDYGEAWIFEDEVVMVAGANASKSWNPKDYTFAAVNYADVRPGIWQPEARIADMELAGIWASLCFPSTVFGFAGSRFMKFKDRDLALACLRAYNDWFVEDWAGSFPGRLIATQLPWLLDIPTAVDEVYRNAARGVRSVSFSENPEKLGAPSIHSGEWDPFFRACEETGTLLNLHIGSSGVTTLPSTDSPVEVPAFLFPLNSLSAAVDWLYSKVPVRFPDLRIVLSEGGIGWVPLVLDRLDYIASEWVPGGLTDTWAGVDLTPREVFQRNFRFTSYYDPSSIQLIEQIGVENVMFEADYPHLDSSWPMTQEVMRAQFGSLNDDQIARVTYRNACELYSIPEPSESDIARLLASS